MMTFGFFILII